MTYVLRYSDLWLGANGRALNPLEVEIICDGDSHADCGALCIRKWIEVERVETSAAEDTAA